MNTTINFLKHFNPCTTSPHKVAEYYAAYQKEKELNPWLSLSIDTRSGGKSGSHADKVRRDNKARVMIIHGPECKVCGFSFTGALEPHHVIPLSKGGSHEIDNQVVLCNRCHRMVHCVSRGHGSNEIKKAVSKREFQKIVEYARRC